MKLYAVGGCVRDSLLGKVPKDIDFVVVGATPGDMIELGLHQVGADFPVFLDNSGVEYALARRERSTGNGYNDFEVDFDPSVTLEEDLQRRDLTINALACPVEWDTRFDVNQFHRDNVIDFVGGLEDLDNKVLRCISEEAFREDPLRVLRLARFAARYIQFTIDPDTTKVCRRMVVDGMIRSLSAERVYTEIEKGFSEPFPSRFCKVLEYDFDNVLSSLVGLMNPSYANITFLDDPNLTNVQRWVMLFNMQSNESVCNNRNIALSNDIRSLHRYVIDACILLMDIDDRFPERMLAFGEKYRIDQEPWYTLQAWVLIMRTMLPYYDEDRYTHFVTTFAVVRNALREVSFANLTEYQKNHLKGPNIKRAINDMRYAFLMDRMKFVSPYKVKEQL